MSAGCALVASDTPPVTEFLRHRETARLFPFFDGGQMVEHVCDLLDAPEEATTIGRTARTEAVTPYDLNQVCLPRIVGLLGHTARPRPA